MNAFTIPKKKSLSYFSPHKKDNLSSKISGISVCRNNTFSTLNSSKPTIKDLETQNSKLINITHLESNTTKNIEKYLIKTSSRVRCKDNLIKYFNHSSNKYASTKEEVSFFESRGSIF